MAIVLLCFMVTTLCSLDRAAMSVAVLPMATAFGYTETDKGLVGSSYFWGYTLSNVLSGVLCTAVEPWLVLTVGAAMWSTFTVLTPAAAFTSLPALLACRMLMGVAEGVCLPTMHALITIWAAKGERSRALALVTSGITVGTVGSLYLAPQLVALFGWPSVFATFGTAGFFWCALWLPVAATSPAELKTVHECERDDQECRLDSAGAGAGTEPSGGSLEMAQRSWSSIPWGQLVASPAMRGVVACSVAHNTALFLLLSWLPSYFAETFGLGIAEASMLAAPPWVANFAVANLAGWAADALGKTGVPVGDVRRWLQLVGSFGPACCLLRIAMGSLSQEEALFWFTAALGLNGCSTVGFNAAPQDMARRLSPVLYGVANAAGCLGGSLSVFLTGAALEAFPEGGFGMAFAVAAGVYLVGGSAFYLSYRGVREFD